MFFFFSESCNTYIKTFLVCFPNSHSQNQHIQYHLGHWPFERLALKLLSETFPAWNVTKVSELRSDPIVVVLLVLVHPNLSIAYVEVIIRDKDTNTHKDKDKGNHNYHLKGNLSQSNWVPAKHQKLNTKTNTKTTKTMTIIIWKETSARRIEFLRSTLLPLLHLYGDLFLTEDNFGRGSLYICNLQCKGCQKNTSILNLPENVANMRAWDYFEGSATHPGFEAQLQVFCSPDVEAWVVGAQTLKELSEVKIKYYRGCCRHYL